MIAAVCANPCIDRAVVIDSFTYGGMNRIRESRSDGSGKGVNVPLACARLGLQAACIGIMPVEHNELVLNRLKEGGCASEFVQCAGSVRVNMKMVDKSTGDITELNEGGPPVSSKEIGMLVEMAVRWAKRCSHIVLTGSAPPGCPADIYRTIIRAVKEAAPNCACVLDADNNRLSEGLKAVPYIVKPNRYELEMLCGRKLPDTRDIHAGAMKIIGLGVGIVAVTMGKDGAYITDGKDAFFAPAPKVEVKSTVGAGDSFVAGMLLGLTNGRPLEDIFRCGMAAAASSLVAAGTGLVNVELFKAYLAKIDMKRVA